MRIALLSHLASTQAPTGAERSLVLLARGLAEQGHEVGVVAPGPWVLAGELAASPVDLEVIPCRCCWLTAHDPQPWPLQVGRALRYAIPDPGRSRIERWLRRWQPDVVHVNCLPHLRGAGAAAAAGLPVVWHLREIVPPGPRRRWLAGRLRRHAGQIVAVSQAVAAWVAEEGLGDRVEVVYNGVQAPTRLPSADEARRTLALPQDGCLIGLLGQIIAHKGAIELIRAAHLALTEEPRLRFVIAGAGKPAFLARVQDEIGGGNHSDRFHLLPPQEEIWPLMAAIDALALTTMTPDPLPRTVLEAMAAARPVVGFASGGAVEMVREDETGWLTETGDLPALAKLMVRIARDPQRARAMGAAGAERARRKHSIAEHLRRMEKVLVRAAGVEQ
jgi:glycosyltransferase involved in cell wall biosynthesis